MKHTLKIISALLLVQQGAYAEEDKSLAGCAVELNSYFYNLEGLTKQEGEKDYIVKFNSGKEEQSIAFNVCDYAKREASDGRLGFANMLSDGKVITGDYKHLTSDSIDDVKVELVDEHRPDMGLRLTYQNSQFRCNKTHDWQFIIEAACDEEVETPQAVFDAKSLEDTCNPRVILTSQFACPQFSLHALWNFFKKYSAGFGCIFMVLGAFLMFMGGRYYEATMFIAAQLSIAAVLLILLFASVMPAGVPEWSVWLSLGVSLGIGAGVGAAAKRWVRVGVLFVGALLGSFIGLALFNTLVHRISQGNPLLGLWITIMITAVAVAGLSMIFFDSAVIIGSSIVGSYLLFRGISVFAGGYPNEFIIYQDYNNETLREMPVSFLIYTCVITICAIIALVFQNKQRAGNENAYNYRQYDFKYRRV